MKKQEKIHPNPERCTMDLKEIKQILTLMDEHEVTEFMFERKDTKILLRRGGGEGSGAPMMQFVQPTAMHTPQVPAAAANAASAATALVVEDASLFTITSPMVGTFYASPSPDSEPYVKPGAKVTSGSTVCIIEAMKIMNEIKAEVNGTVEQVCVKNGQPVEFGQALCKVRLD